MLSEWLLLMYPSSLGFRGAFALLIWWANGISFLLIGYQISLVRITLITWWSCLQWSSCHQLSKEFVECYADHLTNPPWSTLVLSKIEVNLIDFLPMMFDMPMESPLGSSKIRAATLMKLTYVVGRCPWWLKFKR